MARTPQHPRWEVLDDVGRSNTNKESETARLRVPGGWLYRTIVFFGFMGSGAGTAVTQTFIPDPNGD